MAISFRVPVILILLFVALYFTLHHAIQNTPPINIALEEIAQSESISKFSLDDLEIYLQEILDKLRSGKSISYETEKNLAKIKALLAIYASANHELAAKLIAMISEILELNSELIHLGDGEHQTDNN